MGTLRLLRLPVMLALLVVAAAILAGCAKRPEGPVTPPQDSEGNYVIQATTGNRFDPEDAKVPVGATVLWKISGTHDVQSGSEFKSATLNNGQSYKHTFTEAGTFDYVCNLHAPSMAGTITVEGAAA